MILDDRAEIKRRDPSNARDVLAGFPAQCRAACELRMDPALGGPRPSLVVVAGMGGSAASGDLLAACAAERVDIPILVHRGYGIPTIAAGHTLVLASSYSGETEEVISAVEAALTRGLAVAAITTGGRLGALVARHRLPRVILPAGLMPRMALGSLFFPALGALAHVGLGIASASEVTEALTIVEELAAGLAPDRPAAENEAKRLALAIGPRIPVIYGGPETAAVAYRFKTDVEENAKTFALAGAVPEMNHNEIEAWRAPGATGFALVLLRDTTEPEAIGRRFDILRDLVADAAGGVTEAWTRGRGRLARLLSLLYLGQWTSYYLALLRDVDPWAVPLLDELKRRVGAARLETP